MQLDICTRPQYSTRFQYYIWAQLWPLPVWSASYHKAHGVGSVCHRVELDGLLGVELQFYHCSTRESSFPDCGSRRTSHLGRYRCRQARVLPHIQDVLWQIPQGSRSAAKTPAFSLITRRDKSTSPVVPSMNSTARRKPGQGVEFGDPPGGYRHYWRGDILRGVWFAVCLA